MMFNSLKRRCKLSFVVPLVYLFLRGVAELKKLQVEGFKHSSVSLGRIGYPHGGEVTIECGHLCLGLMTCWIVYTELG
jgi:hypothetical protein